MRRSVREAIVGFSLLAALVGGAGLWFWLRGMSLGQSQWQVRLKLDDAAGLAPRSAVTYRGVQVGHVRSIEATNEAVVAVLEINAPGLKLPRPVSAQVQSGSLLGADAQVALFGSAQAVPADMPGPLSSRCDNQRIVCSDSVIVGRTAPSLSTVTDLVQRMLEDADRGKLVPTVTNAAHKFEVTQRGHGLPQAGPGPREQARSRRRQRRCRHRPHPQRRRRHRHADYRAPVAADRGQRRGAHRSLESRGW